MRRFIFFLLFFVSFPSYSQDTITTVEGRYQGKSLYFQNPFTADNHTGCVYAYEVYRGKNLVNKDSVQESAFEVMLTNLSFTIGDSVTVKLYHHKDCQPKLLNFDHMPRLYTIPVVYFEYIKDSSGITLRFKTVDEESRLIFSIEQYRWNKWIRLGEVEGKGKADTNSYAFHIADLHSEENIFRIVQNTPRGNRVISEGLICPYRGEKIRTDIQKKTAVVHLSRESMYEVYDSRGNMLKKGMGNTIDLGSYRRKNTFYINIDNTTITCRLR